MVTSLKYEDRLEGLSNYSLWKERIKLVLLVNDLWEFVDTKIMSPINAAELARHKKSDAKAKLIILDGVKDHLIPHLIKKNTTWDMWEAVKALFQKKNKNWKMIYREKLRDIKMIDGEIVILYLTRVQQVCDELSAIANDVPEAEFVRIALKGFSE